MIPAIFNHRYTRVVGASLVLGTVLSHLMIERAYSQESTAATPAYEMEDVFPEMKFSQPLGIVQAPNDKDRLFILEKTGQIHVITGLSKEKPTKSLFLDLTEPNDGTLEITSECGVLGLAFPPNHDESRQFYVYYSFRDGKQLYQRVARFEVTKENPDHSDKSTEQPLITQEDMAANHNGGDLQFGPDGYLYISVGDGGSGNDKLDLGRFIDQGFHGGILRIDVDKREGNLAPNPHSTIALDEDGKAFYSIPVDNPFVGVTKHHGRDLKPKEVRTEFWATGLRNAWRMSFDPVTQRLFTGDVGQNLYEEVNIIEKGADYGWSYREALQPFPLGPGGKDEPQGFKPVDPIFEYPRTVGVSVTGGVVYHGNRLPELRQHYLFADYGLGVIFALKDVGEPRWVGTELTREPGIAGIGYDPRDGEVLFANMASGKIKRLKAKK